MRKILFWIFVLLMLSSVAVASEVGQFWSIQRTAPTNYSYSNDQNFHYMYNTGATWVNLSNMGPGSKFCGVSGAEPLKVIGGVACSDPWFAPRIDTEPANSFNYIAFGSGTEGNATLRFAPGENETIYVNISGRAGSYYYAAAVSCNYSIEVRNSDNSLNSLLLLMDVNNGTVHDFEFTDIEIPANGFLDFNSIREGGQSNMAQTFNITRVPGNTPPNMTYINITPSNPNVLDNLIGFCNATDEDDDQLTYNYTWNKNGVGYTSGITTVDYLTILDSNNYTTLDSEWFSVPPGAQGASAVLDGNFSTYATPFSTTSNLYVNYTMPANITSVIWETKDGDAGGTNYTNTTLTSDYLNNTLNFKITSTTAGGARSEWNAWNHTANDWQLVYTGSWFIYDHRVLLDGAIISLGYNETTKGDNWSLTCWADDGTIVSDPLESSNVTISGVAPIMVNTTITPTTAYGNTTLLGWCNATDYDADTVMYNFTWYKNDTSILTSNSTYFAQATQINVGNLSSSNFDAGDNISIECLAYDGILYSDRLNSSQIEISGSAPDIINSSIAPAIAYSNTTLLGYCNSSDIDADTLKYNYTWYKNTTSILTGQTSGSFEQGVQSNVYNLTSSNFSEGDNITLGCLAYDGALYSTALNSSQIEISGSAPDIVNSSISPSIAYTNTTLLGWCNASDIDLDTLKYNYTWYKNTTSILTGQTSGSFAQSLQSNIYNLTSSNFSAGDNITLGCSAYDGSLNSDWLNSSPIQILGSVPLIINSSISPATAYGNTTLLGWCNASDIDLDTLKYNYTWYKNTTSILTGQTSGNFAQGVQSNIYNLTSGNFSQGDNITLGCLAYDGILYSDRLNSSELTIQGSIPDTHTAQISPITPYYNETLLGYCNGSDIDTSVVNYYYKWFKNNVLNDSGYVDNIGYYSTLYETPTNFENGTSSCTDVTNATDANWATYIRGCSPAPFVYLEAIALTNYTHPTGAQNATITLKTNCFIGSGEPKNSTFYWNYSLGNWTPLYEIVCDGATQIPTLDVPADGMTSSPLRFRHISSYSVLGETLQFYDANVTFNGYTTGYPNNDNINVNNISSVDTSVGDFWKFECTTADGTNSTPLNSSIAQVRGYSQIVFAGKGATTPEYLSNFSFSLTNTTTTYHTITNYSDTLLLELGLYTINYNATGWNDGTDTLVLSAETNTTKTLLFYNTELLIVPTQTYDGLNISGFTVNVSNAVYDNVTYVAGNSINFSLSNGTYTFTFNKTGWLDFSEDLYFSGTTYAPNLSQSEVNVDAINSFTSVAIANYSIEFFNGTYSGNYTIDGYNTSIGLPPNNYTVIGSVTGYADYITTLNMTALDNKSMTLSFSPGTLEVRPNQTISESPISGFTVVLESALLNTSAYSSGPAVNISVLSGNYSIAINKTGYINYTNTTEITTGYKLTQPQMYQSSLIVNAVKIVTGEVLNNFGVELDNGTETFYQYMTGYNGTLNLPAGNYTYIANKTSYNSDIGTINLTAGDTQYKTFLFGDMTMYIDPIDLFDDTNITGFTVNVNRSGYSETKYETGGVANFSLIEGIYSVLVNKSGYIRYYNNTYYEDGVTRPGISQSKLNLLVRPIFSATTLTDYNVTNVNTSTIHYPNPVTGLTSMFLNTSNYTFTLMSPGFVDTNFTYETLAGVISNYTATINGVFNLSFIDEDTLGAFNMSSFLTMDGYVYCGNNISQSLVYTNESPTTFNLSIGCELDKLRFVLTYGDENDSITQETYYRTFILEDLTQGIYLVDLTHTSVILNTFKIFSLFDNFIRPRMIIRKGLENSTPQIIGDYFDAEAKMTAYLIDFDEYTLTIESDNQPNRNLGNYIPDTAGEKTIRLFDITLDKYPAGFTSSVFYGIGLLNVTEITPLLAASYVDTTNLTISTKFVVYNRSRAGNILYEQIDITPEHDYTFPLTGILQNTTVVGVLFINYNGTQYEYQQAFLVDQEIAFSFKDYISSGWLDWFITLMLSFLALMFTIPTASWGALIIIGIGLFLKIIGLYSLGYGIIVLGLLIATIKFFTEKA